MPSIRSSALSLSLIIALLSVAAALWPRAPDTAKTPTSTEAMVSVEVKRDFFGGDDPSVRWRPAQGGLVDVLIDLDDDDDDLERALEREYGIDLRLNSRHADAANLFRAQVPEQRVESLLSALASRPGVEAAERDGIVEAFALSSPLPPNDPLYMFQWNFDQTRAESAWSSVTGDGVIVAVIDTGVAYENNGPGQKRGILVPDLAATSIVAGYDFVDDDAQPYDQHGHGTHVAGTIAQSTNNDYGVAGLAYGSAIMPLRVLDGQGKGGFGGVADAIRFAADHGAGVINMSLGSFLPSRAVELAIRYAHERGVVVVAAAGNSGTKIRTYPAGFDHVIAVAATQYDRKPTFYSNHGSFVDIAAPGGNTLEDANDDGRPDGVMQETLKHDDKGRVRFEPTFALYMGTSMAAPHVAAAAALLISRGVSNPDEVERLLRESASDEDGTWKRRYGDGILDLDAALTAHLLGTGLWHTGGALLLSLLAFWGLRRQDPLSLGVTPNTFSFWGGLALGSGMFFALPLLLPSSAFVYLLSQPLSGWDQWLLGPGARNPLAVSALIPFFLIASLLGLPRGRHLAAGIGIGTGALLITDAWRHTYDVAWLPGIGVVDQGWLIVNGLLCVSLGYLSLKRS